MNKHHDDFDLEKEARKHGENNEIRDTSKASKQPNPFTSSPFDIIMGTLNIGMNDDDEEEEYDDEDDEEDEDESGGSNFYKTVENTPLSRFYDKNGHYDVISSQQIEPDFDITKIEFNKIKFTPKHSVSVELDNLLAINGQVKTHTSRCIISLNKLHRAVSNKDYLLETLGIDKVNGYNVNVLSFFSIEYDTVFVPVVIYKRNTPYTHATNALVYFNENDELSVYIPKFGRRYSTVFSTTIAYNDDETTGYEDAVEYTIFKRFGTLLDIYRLAFADTTITESVSLKALGTYEAARSIKKYNYAKSSIVEIGTIDVANYTEADVVTHNVYKTYIESMIRTNTKISVYILCHEGLDSLGLSVISALNVSEIYDKVKILPIADGIILDIGL